MKEALYYKKLNKNKVKCLLCPHACTIKNGDYGKCNTRINKNGKLYSTSYGKLCSANPDPIEKKPLYHFLPSSLAYSIATAGCNLHCKFCQNWKISQSKPGEIPSKNMEPKQVVKNAIAGNCESIAYTYTDPVAFYEFTLDTSKVAKKENLKNVTVANGYINPKPLKKLCKYLDASDIDLKGMDDDFYKDICGARLKPVLNSIKTMHKNGIWIELTNLIIPGLNDSTENINNLVDWVQNNLGNNVPLHFSGFYPAYKLKDKLPTSLKTLRKARKIALDKGINYVYTGNLPDLKGNATYCHNCKELLIKRESFNVIENKIKNGKCPNCNTKIPGVFQ